MRSGLNYAKSSLKEENKKSLEGQMSVMTEKLNEEMVEAKTEID